MQLVTDKTRQDKTRQDKTICNSYELCCQVIGDIYEDNGFGSAGGRVYDINGIAPALGAAHFSQVKYVLIKRK